MVTRTKSERGRKVSESLDTLVLLGDRALRLRELTEESLAREIARQTERLQQEGRAYLAWKRRLLRTTPDGESALHRAV